MRVCFVDRPRIPSQACSVRPSRSRSRSGRCPVPRVTTVAAVCRFLSLIPSFFPPPPSLPPSPSICACRIMYTYTQSRPIHWVSTQGVHWGYFGENRCTPISTDDGTETTYLRLASSLIVANTTHASQDGSYVSQYSRGDSMRAVLHECSPGINQSSHTVSHAVSDQSELTKCIT